MDLPQSDFIGRNELGEYVSVLSDPQYTRSTSSPSSFLSSSSPPSPSPSSLSSSPSPSPSSSSPRFIYTPEVLTCFITPQLAALYTALTGESASSLTKGELARRLANRPIYIPSSFFPYFLLGAYVTTSKGEILITSPADLHHIQGTGTISHFATKTNRRFNASRFTPCADDFYTYHR